jgi:outer membrane protein OmpA-like peptidoglycan-associated protein
MLRKISRTTQIGRSRWKDTPTAWAANRTALAKRRVEAVTNWLAEHGVNRSRLTAKGYGEAYPSADNSTNEGWGKNRRVELVRM